jgi:uncharacterized SAM-binding protein YcdF (DUF218 family)
MWQRAWRLTVRALAALGLLFVLVSVTPLTSWWARRLSGEWLQPKGDTLIVLGGSMLDGGTIGASSYWRAVYGMRAWRSGEFRRVVVAGGGEFPVSVAIKQFLVCEAVPADIVTVETTSHNTRENALNVAKLLSGDTSRKVLLTSDYHMYRASRAFAKAGVAITTMPFPDAIKQSERWRGRWPAFLLLCDETVKIAYYRLRGWI